MERHLWIVRHAKSSWQDLGTSDFERDLNARGERDGLRMQAALTERDHYAEWLFSSSALRARRTAAFVQAAFNIPEAQLCFEDNLYHVSAEGALGQLKATPHDCRSVAIVAHNPGLTHLVNQLGEAPLLDNLPTFGVAHFSFEGSYAELRFGTATLLELLTPKGL